MTKTFKVLFALPFVASLAFAGEAKSDKDLKKVIEDQGIYVETSQKGIVLSGYVDAGYTYNFGTANDTVGQRFGQDGGQATQQGGDFNLNAFKLALEKPLSDKNELTAGFRADLMVGEDAATLRGDTTHATDGLSDIYLHQAFVQFRAPFGNGIDFKVGKFATPMGYEVAERPANLNYSYGLLWQNLQPLSHTGILATYKVNDIVTTEFGVVNSDWNSADSTNIRTNLNSAGGTVNAQNSVGSDSVGLIASVNVKSKGGNANIKNTVFASNRGSRNVSTTSLPTNNDVREGNLFLWDSWGNWAPKFANDKLLLGYNTDFGVYSGYAKPANTKADKDDTFYGVALFAKYQFTKIFSLAGRAEYAHDSDGVKFGNQGTVASYAGLANQDLWSYTATAGFNIYENMLLRAEYRADFGTNVHGPEKSNDDVAHMVSMNVVYSF